MLKEKEPRPVWAEIDIDNLAHNIKEVRRITKVSTIIMAVVKADAYGHGVEIAAKTFLENGAERLGVATLTEAIQLRKMGFNTPILILGHTPWYKSEDVVKYEVTPTVFSYEQAKNLSEAASSTGKTVKIHVKIDTGMGRLGFLTSDDSINDIVRISKLPSIEVEGIFTHFAMADRRDKSYTRDQFKKYVRVVDELEKRGVDIPIKHVSNSAATIDLPEYNLDMVRPGIILYGLYPSNEVDKSKVNLKPAMTLKAKISYIKTVPEKTGISYGLSFITKRESRIGTLPIGYADGYRRTLSNRAEVGVRGKRAPVVGTVCMDQCMIDLTDIEGTEVGDEVILFGDGSNNAPHIDEVAEWLGTINYEVVCMVGRRVPRVYKKNGKIVEIKDYLIG
ncbi:MAG: alanine racemase [Candidatus Bathyarchaeia archaeon]